MTITADSKTDLVVPKSVQRKAGIRQGDQLEFKVSGGIIHIIPMPAADLEYTPSQKRVVDSRLAKSDDDIAHGRVYGPFHTAEDMAASVEANIRARLPRKRKRIR